MGKVLWVDLSTGTFTEESFGDEVCKNYRSGADLAAHLLYNSIPAGGADPACMRELAKRPGKLARFRIPRPHWAMSVLGKVLRSPEVSLRMDNVL